jgi:pimeloyl-ACP methyl ester carboxylesterase
MDPETATLAALYAAQGTTVVATDYLGYAGSTFPYHPYLHAASEASTVIDSLRAARLAAYQTGANLSNQILLAGYSQGGHASMAAQRAIESDNPTEFTIAAASHMAGPYNLSGALASLDYPVQDNPVFAAFVLTAWNKVYKNIRTLSVFNLGYSNWIGNVFPFDASTASTKTTADYQSLMQWISSSPSDAAYALFDLGFLGTLSQLSSVSDPSQVTGTAASVVYDLAMDAADNTLLNWAPTSKLMLCGGANDPVVRPSIHQQAFATKHPSAKLVDVDKDVAKIYITAHPGQAADVSNPQYMASYHGSSEALACHFRTQDYFATQLGSSR